MTGPEPSVLARRIYGLETEYGVACTVRSGRRLTSDEVARHLFRTVVAWGKSHNVFLRNGSRVYLDVGSHPEYATAECDNLTELVAHDRAGERLLEELRVDATGRLADEGIDADLFLFKNNTDSHGNSYGCHENYLVGRDADFVDLSRLLVPFLVSRQLICGAGKVLPGGRYVLSQRADHMWDPVSSATTRSRPMINTRDEPHADPARFRRLHVIVGDSNRSEVTTWLKVGSTELVLRLIEARVALRDLSLENPARAIRDLSRDLSGRAQVRLANGRTVTGLEMQQTYLQAVRDHLERTGPLPDHLAGVVEMWQKVLDALEADDPSRIDTEIDWAIKARLLRRFAERNGLDPADPKLARLDLSYHDIAPDRGAFELLERRGKVARLLTDEQVADAQQRPPQTTRAKLRGDFIAAATAARVDYTVDWMNLKINHQPARPWELTASSLPRSTVHCTDPLVSSDERVDKLVASLPKD